MAFAKQAVVAAKVNLTDTRVNERSIVCRMKLKISSASQNQTPFRVAFEEHKGTLLLTAHKSYFIRIDD